MLAAKGHYLWACDEMWLNYQELLQGHDEYAYFLVYLTPALTTAPPHTICLLPLRTTGLYYLSAASQGQV